MLFRDLLGGAEQVTVSEAPAAADHGWLGGRAHEIVIPVASAAPAARPPAIMTAPGPWIRAGSLSSFLPGSRVLSAKLYGHPDCFDVILTAHLPGLLAEWDGPPAWWFVRYRDPAPHLRLRLHLENPPEYGLAAVRVGAWADRLRRGGLITDLVLAAYWPETARYGTGITLAAAETLFAMDSAAAVAQLAMQAAAPGIRSRALTAASLADLVTAMSGGQEAGTSWLIRHPGPAGTARASEGDRTVLRQALALAGADTTGTGLLAHPGGQHVAAAWQARAEAAAAYARHVAEPCSGLRPDAVLGTLLHMHHARIHGPGADCESACRRLTRAIAMARAARADAAGRSQR
jgi:thiopeptide-type bacteriocin biosynthesis protein